MMVKIHVVSKLVAEHSNVPISKSTIQLAHVSKSKNVISPNVQCKDLSNPRPPARSTPHWTIETSKSANVAIPTLITDYHGISPVEISSIRTAVAGARVLIKSVLVQSPQSAALLKKIAMVVSSGTNGELVILEKATCAVLEPKLE